MALAITPAKKNTTLVRPSNMTSASVSKPQTTSLGQQQQTEPPIQAYGNTSAAFHASADSRRRQRKPTMEQLEFPSGITERMDAHSGSRIQALYQLHYSDTVVRAVAVTRDQSTGAVLSAPVVLEEMTSAQYRAARDYLDAEAEGKEVVSSSNNNAASGADDARAAATAAAQEDLGIVFTLYLENSPTESFLHTIAARFGISRHCFEVHHLFSKDQCSTQRVFVCTRSCKPQQPQQQQQRDALRGGEAQLLSINLMRFPGFCARVSSCSASLMSRSEFRRLKFSTEVTTLLRRVACDGSGFAVRAALSKMRRTGVINYLGTVNQSHLRAFRFLQKASFKAALLSWLDHPNMRPELAAFVKEPSQQTAAAARRVISNPVNAGLLRTFAETQSFFRTVEWAPANARLQLYRMARRFAWNMMASRRVRGLRPEDENNTSHTTAAGGAGGGAEEDAEITDEEVLAAQLNSTAMKNLKPRNGDFVVAVPQRGSAAAETDEVERDYFTLSQGHVKLLASDEEAAAFSPFDIVIPIPAPGVLDSLPSKEASSHMRALLQRFALLGLVEVPSCFSDDPAKWKWLTSAASSSSSQKKAAQQSNKKEETSGGDVMFRRLLLPITDDILVTEVECDSNKSKSKREGDVSVAADPAPSGQIYDCRRILLNDRMLLQQKRRQKHGLHETCLVASDAKASALDDDPVLREALHLPAPSPFSDIKKRKDQQEQDGSAAASSSSSSSIQLEWARSAGGSVVGGDASRASLQPAMPISDTSRLTSVVSVAVTMRNCSPAQVPIILREHFSLHGVLCEADAQLQHAVHAQLRTCDTEAASVWAQSFCEICYSVKHYRSSECPVHQRRIALRVAEMQRRKMEKAATPAATTTASATSGGAAADVEGKGPENQKTKDYRRTQNSIVIPVARDPESKKWGILVTSSLLLSAGTEKVQPTLAPFVGTHRVKQVGSSPVATVEQLKIALAAAAKSDHAMLKSSLTLVPA